MIFANIFLSTLRRLMGRQFSILEESLPFDRRITADCRMEGESEPSLRQPLNTSTKYVARVTLKCL
ncbi:unnamed protein product [Staurois parvus]|uniref:Uncharacterized protein n=1 Tax=Staurois parvus TaxID=386267 RepID=A0ABN9HNF1_9NEOB|nr:unnamed protein product [Staurois parvus]